MADPVTDPVARCQWCSAELPSADVEHCPACGAALAPATASEPQLPGITTIDPAAILRARLEPPRPRGRLMSFLSGEIAVETDPSVSPESLAPPAGDVRREMLRLELEAERARLEAEQAGLRGDALSDAIEQGKVSLASADSAQEPAQGASGEASGPTAG